MTTVSIGALTDVVSTWNPSRRPDEAFIYIDLTALDNVSKKISGATTVVGADAPSRARQLVVTGDVLVSTVRPNLNSVAVVPPELDGATVSTGFTVLRPGKNLEGRYLFHWVRSPSFIEDMIRNATGASYPAVSDRIIKGSIMPTPSLKEQCRIAAILDQADALRAKRRQILAHLETLTQSIFSDMFGSTASSTGRVDLRSLSAVITKGTTPTSLGLQFTRQGVPFVRVQNLQQGTVQFASGDLFIDADTHEALRRSVIQPNDLLLSIAGTIGRVSIVPENAPEMNCNQAVAIVRLLDPGIGAWLMAWLNSSDAKRQIHASSVTATIPNLSLSQIGQLTVPIVADDTIARFVRRSDAVHAQRGAVLAAQVGDNELFASLQYRAFRGEL